MRFASFRSIYFDTTNRFLYRIQYKNAKQLIYFNTTNRFLYGIQYKKCKTVCAPKNILYISTYSVKHTKNKAFHYYLYYYCYGWWSHVVLEYAPQACGEGFFGRPCEGNDAVDRPPIDHKKMGGLFFRRQRTESQSDVTVIFYSFHRE